MTMSAEGEGKKMAIVMVRTANHEIKSFYGDCQELKSDGSLIIFQFEETTEIVWEGIFGKRKMERKRKEQRVVATFPAGQWKRVVWGDANQEQA